MGEKISYISPNWIFVVFLCPLLPVFFPSFPKFFETLYDMNSLLPYFRPSTPSVKVEQLLDGLKGEKIKIQGEKISYIFPQLDFCAHPLLPAFFFQVSYNLMKNCSCSVILSLFFSFPLSFLSFSPFFLSARALFL